MAGSNVARASKDDEPKPQSRGRMSFRVSPELEREVRDCVLTLSGPPHFLNLSRFLEDAIRAHLDGLRRTANKGQPWPSWSRPMKRGRPVKGPRR